MGQVEFFGVRHHSPTAARLVAQRIADDPPVAVLIEGPTEFNDQLDELALDHQLPIMIYSWAPLFPDAEAGTTEYAARRAGYYPLCDYSPEWTAFSTARKAGVTTQFIDLPWLAMVDVATAENRFAEPETAEDDTDAALRKLYAELGVDRIDNLFDELIEVEADLSLVNYLERIELIGSLLRRRTEDQETLLRERFMAARIAEVSAETEGSVLVVCGAAHIEGLKAELANPSPADEPWRPDPDDDRYGIALAPTSYVNLDALDGYNAGQPTPGFYDAIWQDRNAGRSDTVERLLATVLADLREANQSVSTADVIATLTTARGLAALRGHNQLWRTDLLDGMTSALVKDDAGEDHALLRRAKTVLRGDRLGKLAPGARRPPLVAEIQIELAALGLEPKPTLRTEAADLTDTIGLRRSRLLHSLITLDVPIGKLTKSADSDGTEQWAIKWSTDYEGSMVAAARLGGTLNDAVTNQLLTEAAEITNNPTAAAKLMFKAALCGLDHLTESLQARTDTILATCGDLAALGEALGLLMRLYRYDPLLRTTGRSDLGTLVATAFDRALRLTERIGHQTDGPIIDGIIETIKVVTDTLERVQTSLELDAAGWDHALALLVEDPDQAAGLRGAALGGRWLSGAAPDEQLASTIKQVSSAEQLGDFVAGLLTVAREAALRRPELLAELDRLITEFVDEDFLAAVPGLRRAFSRYPPRERARVAEIVLGEQAEFALDRFVADESDALAIAAFEAELGATMTRFLGRGMS